MWSQHVKKVLTGISQHVKILDQVVRQELKIGLDMPRYSQQYSNIGRNMPRMS
jgi:hypothetical protein